MSARILLALIVLPMSIAPEPRPVAPVVSIRAAPWHGHMRAYLATSGDFFIMFDYASLTKSGD